MEIKIERYGHAAILNCKGDLTEDTLDVFSNEVKRQLEDNVSDFIVNLAEVHFLDSAGLERLLDLQDEVIEKSGQVRLTSLSEHVAKIFEITRLDGSFEIANDMTEAVRGV